uniref:Uncharacterized protein n=1 Tax=Tanacetum cinerariifolium TaxID=118510 RepID=A0A6L2NSF7_TANCI|nr:hypothetical protein [Tanacetum cinerariifolium]GEW55530.1 hypothetical protein [Tanacetum cinerariifolium]
MTQEEIENQKGIEQAVKSEIKKGKKYLIDILGHSVVDKVYKDKIKYDKYCLKMLNRRSQGKITNCDVLSKEKGPISLKLVPKGLKLGGQQFTLMRKKLDALHQTEAKLELDLSKPLEEQDPIVKLNLLQRRKGKMMMTFMTTSSQQRGTRRLFSLVMLGQFSRQRLHQGLGMDDLARTFNSFFYAKVEKRNLNPNKQMRLTEHLRH